MLHTSRSSYKWSPWTNIDRWSEPRAMGILCRHPPVPEVAQHSVNPCLVGGVRTVVSGREPAAQRADRPVLLRFTEAVTRWCCDTAGMLMNEVKRTSVLAPDAAACNR